MVCRRGEPSADWISVRIGLRSRPLAFQCWTAATVSSIDASPIASSMERRPRAARCSRTSSAMYSKNVSTNSGKPEFVGSFFEYIAEEVRERLAALGLRSIEEAIGEASMLDTVAAVQHWKASGLDLRPILTEIQSADGSPRRHTIDQDHGLEKALDHTLIEMSRDALRDKTAVHIELPVRNVNRTVGTMLGHEVTKAYPHGLPDNTIDISLFGSAGQSLGAFLPAGITLRLFGDANDYVGKGISGGRVVVRPDRSASLPAEHNVIAGNEAERSGRTTTRPPESPLPT